MEIPPPLQSALVALRRIGGRPRLVGGCVRDWLLGLTPKDFDIEVFGIDYEQMGRALSAFGSTDLVGRSFGVLKVRLADAKYDFSLPRWESKTGEGHRGFAVAPDPDLPEAEAAARRDFTINSIAYDPFEKRLIDPHGGERDLRACLLRHTGPAFVEDPLRVLRGMQFAARFDLTLAPETAVLAKSIRDTFNELPIERIWSEWDKWAKKAAKPSRGLLVLKQTGWLTHFPELSALDGLPQKSEWHPEGNAFVQTSHSLDALVTLPEWNSYPEAVRQLLSFAVLAHDFGKAPTASQGLRGHRLRWASPGYKAARAAPTKSFLQRIGAPLDLVDYVRPLVVNRLARHASRNPLRDASIRYLAYKVAPATLEQLITVMMSDHLGRPSIASAEAISWIQQLKDTAQRLEVGSRAPKPIVLGRHIIALGIAPGPHFKKALDAAFKSQLDGAFYDESGGLEWIQNYLRVHPIRGK